jgi:hypothetical protein
VGTWDVGPFDNDDAADFAGDLDEVDVQEREILVRSALEQAAKTSDELDAVDAIRAVAAAALVAAQCPGGAAVCANYGPATQMPGFPSSFTLLAVDAVDQVLAERSES